MDEMEKLNMTQREAVRKAIKLARKTPGGRNVVETPDGGEAYAYPSGNTIHWGFNSPANGWCIARGTEAL